MNLENICYGCFQEKPEGFSVCPHCGFNVDEEQPFLALPMGTILNGRYMTGKVLGVGGFGITYLGYDLTLEIKVAIKEYMPSGLATRHSDRYSVALTGRGLEDYQNGMDRFLDEARILAKLQNTPNVVSVQNYFKENNTAYFVMEYIDGMSLKAYIAAKGGRIPLDQALTVLMPVMQALTKVHAMNLTHRDISPDNISITSGGESKLLDFGAARFSVGDEKSVSVILKHGYAPEEQYSSRGNQGPWTDVYAMGATLYRCVTGELPPDSIMRVHNDTLKKPSEMGVSLPPNVERAIMKALSVKAEDRFPTMEAFIGGLTGNQAAPTAFQRRTVADADKEKYEVYMEQWRGSNGKSITSQNYFNDRIPEDERLTEFEEGETYYYDVWVKAKEGYTVSKNASVYLSGMPCQDVANKLETSDPEGAAPDGCFFDGWYYGLMKVPCVFDQICVNGIEVTKDNMNDVLGDADGASATVSYNPDTKTLTLDHATINVQDAGVGIDTKVPNLTIVLKGNNQITGTEEAYYALYSHNDLTITGSGSLTTSGTAFGLYGNRSITIQGGATVDITVARSSEGADQPLTAVRAINGVTVDGATLNAKNIGAPGTYFGALGISAGLTARNGAKVNIFSANGDAIPTSLVASGKGTVVKASSGSSEHYGISVKNEPPFTISDGATVIASGGKAAMYRKPDLTGYTNPYIMAGVDADGAVEVKDPAGTAYHTNNYVSISPDKASAAGQNGTANKGKTNAGAPQTGDNSQMMLWISLMLVCCGVIGTTAYGRRKKQQMR